MGEIVALSKSSIHTFSKTPTNSLFLVKGEGVEGDAHKGTMVKHRSRVKVDPLQPNLRQVHLIHYELIEELQEKGFRVIPSSMGENITTKNIDLLALPTDTELKIGTEVILRVTGLRNPCHQLDNFQKGLTSAVLDRDKDGKLVRKAGIMSIVSNSGTISVGDNIEVVLPSEPYKTLECV